MDELSPEYVAAIEEVTADFYRFLHETSLKHGMAHGLVSSIILSSIAVGVADQMLEKFPIEKPEASLKLVP